jgi:hypothetical protein
VTASISPPTGDFSRNILKNISAANGIDIAVPLF